MHLHNKLAPGILSLILLAGAVSQWAHASQASQQANPPGQQTIQPTPLPSDVDANDLALPVWMRPATATAPAKTTPSKNNTAANVPGADVPLTDTQTGRAGQVVKKGDVFTIKSIVENVTLPVTVVDQKQHLVTDLRPTDFVVYEDSQPQQIIQFSRADIPVSIGILVDNSGSMREKRAAVTKAVVNLIKASNKDDEGFVVNFNDEPYLDQDFTANVSLMQEALDRLDSRGGTALYDAVIASADHLAKAAKKDKKVLLVITDGEDNESRESLEQAIRSVQDENGPAIYTIGILGNDGKQRRARRALEGLSMQTGGVAFFPKSLEEVDAISQAIAHDIRNQYSLTYKPSNPQTNGGWRSVKVEARASGRQLNVRTKNGYFAGTQRASSNNQQPK